MTKSEFRSIRLKNGLSQKSFGSLLGVSERMIQYKESEHFPEHNITLRDRKMIEQLKKLKQIR